MSYFQRYLKYKHKYLTLKNQLEQVGGSCGGDHDSKMDVLELESLSDTPQYSEDLEKTLQTGGNNEDSESAVKSESENESSEEPVEEKPAEENGDESDRDSLATTVNGSDSEDESEDESEDNSDSEEEDEEGQIGGGRFFNNVMDDLSSSIHSFDLQKGGFDSELSPLSDFDIE